MKVNQVFASLGLMGLLGGAQAEPVKIGVIQPLTGSVAYDGATTVEGVRLAMEQRLAKGLSKEVELIVEDGECQPSKSVNAAEKLIQRDKVSIILGAFCSSATIAVMSVAEKYGVPLITGVSSKTDLTEKGNKWFFRTAETESISANAFAEILVDQLDLKKIAYIGVNDDWGRNSIEEFSANIEAHGGETISKLYFDHGVTDFYTMLTRIRATKPDGVFVAAETQDGSILVKQMSEVGLQSNVFGVGSWATADFARLTGDASEGIYAAVPYVYTIDRPENIEFVEVYEKKFNKKPGKYSVAGYNTINVILDAIERAEDGSPDALRLSLEQTDYNGPNGNFKFDEKRQAYGFDAVLVQLQKGSPVIVTSTQVVAP